MRADKQRVSGTKLGRTKDVLLITPFAALPLAIGALVLFKAFRLMWALWRETVDILSALPTSERAEAYAIMFAGTSLFIPLILLASGYALVKRRTEATNGRPPNE